MKKIRILPVYPEFPKNTFWSFSYAFPYIGKKAVMPPLGLATVAAMIPEDKFHVQKIIDLNITPLIEEDIKNTDLIFTSSMIVQESSHNEVIDRAHFYGKKVVAGGPFPTSYPERNSLADYIIAGEAEITLPPFLEDFLNKIPKKIYIEKEIIESDRNIAELTKTKKPNLAKTPLPRLDLLGDLNEYHSMAIQYSRGCPHTCEFCDIIKLYGREPRTKSPEQMIQEFETLKKILAHCPSNKCLGGQISKVD